MIKKSFKPKRTGTAVTVLAFDTSTEILTAALQVGSRRFRVQVRSVPRHSDSMFITLGRFLRRKGADFNQINLVAVGLGPGSFSGLRVGVTVAKTMSYALGCHLVGLSTLQVIAMNYRFHPKPICIAQDARRGNVYTATFSQGREIVSPRLQRGEEFIAGLNGQVSYAGDALELYNKEMKQVCDRANLFMDPTRWIPQAEQMISLAFQRWHRNEMDDCFRLSPQYLYDDKCNVTEPRPFKGNKNYGNRKTQKIQ